MYDYLELKDYKTGLKLLHSSLIPVIRIMYTWTMFISARLLEADKQYEKKQWYNLTKHCLWISPIRKFIKISLMCKIEKKRDFQKLIEAYKNYLDEMKSSPGY